MKASGTALGPGLAHDRRAAAPMGRMTALLTKKEAKKKKKSPLMAGVLLLDKSLNAFLISSKEAYGFGPVAVEPGHNVGFNDGNCSFTAILTTCKPTSTPGARVPSLPVTADTSTRNSRLKSQKASPCTRQSYAAFYIPAPYRCGHLASSGDGAGE